MKRLVLIALAALFSTAAMAEVYRPLTTFSISHNPHAATESTTEPQSSVQVMRLLSTTDVYVSIGSTATSSSMVVPAYTPEYFRISEGEVLTALSRSATGTLFITEMTK